MSLFQYLNNEALDEDQKQKARIFEMIKKNVDDNEVALNELTQFQKLNLYKTINYLNNSIDQVLYNIRDNEEGYINVDSAYPIIYAYNNLAILMQTYKINAIVSNDKNKIYKILDEISVKLNAVIDMLIIGDEDYETIAFIKDEIDNKTFNTIIDMPVITKQTLKTTKLEKQIKKMKEIAPPAPKAEVDEVDAEEPEDEDDED
jgi:hypothetical protein